MRTSFHSHVARRQSRQQPGYVAPFRGRLAERNALRQALTAAAAGQDLQAFHQGMILWRRLQREHRESQGMLEWAVLELADGWAVSRLMEEGFELSLPLVERFVSELEERSKGWCYRSSAHLYEGVWEVLWAWAMACQERQEAFGEFLLARAHPVCPDTSYERSKGRGLLDWPGMRLGAFLTGRLFDWPSLDPSIRHWIPEGGVFVTPLQLAWSRGQTGLCMALVDAGLSPTVPEPRSIWPTWTLAAVCNDVNGWLQSLPGGPARALAENRSQDQRDSMGLPISFGGVWQWLRIRLLDEALPAVTERPSAVRF